MNVPFWIGFLGRGFSFGQQKRPFLSSFWFVIPWAFSHVSALKYSRAMMKSTLSGPDIPIIITLLSSSVGADFSWCTHPFFISTVEPRSTDTRFIRTVLFVPTKSSYIFSEITHFIQTPGNTDNGHFSVSRVTSSHILSTPLYGHWLSAHCLFSLSKSCDNCRHSTLFK